MAKAHKCHLSDRRSVLVWSSKTTHRSLASASSSPSLLVRLLGCVRRCRKLEQRYRIGFRGAPKYASLRHRQRTLSRDARLHEVCDTSRDTTRRIRSNRRAAPAKPAAIRGMMWQCAFSRQIVPRARYLQQGQRLTATQHSMPSCTICLVVLSLSC